MGRERKVGLFLQQFLFNGTVGEGEVRSFLKLFFKLIYFFDFMKKVHTYRRMVEKCGFFKALEVVGTLVIGIFRTTE